MSTEALLSRRQFLKVAGATGGALLLNQITGTKAEAANETQQLTDQETSSLVTIKETAIFTVVRAVVHLTGRALGLPINPGSERTKRMIREKPVQLLTESTVVSPPIEEGLFRLLPNVLLNDSSQSGRWDIGTLTSLVFAYTHNLQLNEKTKEIKFIKDKFPLDAFLAGMFFWRMQRERGYNHALTAHVTTNALMILSRRLLYKLFPDKLEQPGKD